MRKLFIICALTLLAACSTNDPGTVSVTGGQIRGELTDSTNVMVYKGIPYAAAPVGELRWKKPQPVKPWKGVRDCTEFGTISIQLGHEPGTLWWKEFYWEGFPTQGEDCLFLNVYAPAATIGKSDAKLPVAMWIHGGAFHNGYSNEITMDGDAWASRGVILVTINYRLGLMGFLNHPELTEESGDGTSGGYGMYDQIAALDWICENIAQFGGDPGNITVFGQSAGAMSVKNLVCSPLAKDKIAKAIIQSGGGLSRIGGRGAQAMSQASYDRTGTSIQQAGGFENLAAMRKATPEQLRAAVDKMQRAPSYRPHTDGVMLTESFDEAVWNNTVADIPFMIGCTAQDMGGLGGDAIGLFAQVRDSLSTKPVYRYFFQRNLPGDDEDPATDPGAFHSSELWYMFHSLKNSWRPFTKADYALSDRMMDHWTNFCKYGDPKGGWKRTTPAAPYTQTFDIQ